MLKLSITLGMLASIVWQTTPTNCRQMPNQTLNINQLAAANIERYMDETSRPCENFYQYACGRWYQQHIDEMDYGDVLGQLDYELNKRLEHLLRKSVTNDRNHSNTIVDTTTTTTTPTSSSAITIDENLSNDWQFVPMMVNGNIQNSLWHKIQIYYKSCKKVKPYNLKKYLQLIPPGSESHWYILAKQQGGRNWQMDNFHWQEAIAKLRLYGLNGVLLKEQILPLWDESSIMSIYLDKPDVSETNPMGEGVIIELLMDIGQTKRSANEIAREVTQFELQLHKLQEIEDDEGPKEMQLSYLLEYMPQIDWLQYLRELKGPSTDLSTTVIIQNIPYMRELVKLLNAVEPSTQCNYIMLRFLLYLQQIGPAEISRQECIASLRRAMPLGMSYLIGMNFYKEPKKNDEQIKRIFEQLKKTLRKILQQNRLQLPEVIVKTQLAKVDHMRIRIGYASRNQSIEYYDAYYERVALDANSFYANQLSLLRLAVELSHESLDVSTNQQNISNNEGMFLMAEYKGSSSLPYYVKARNMVVVPYGFLQMPIYHRNLRDIFKYSIVGFILAHEIFHGFDLSGIDYDYVGNLMGPSEEISANQRFMQGLRCMQNELAIGSRSLNEKLADYEGIRLAYNAYFLNAPKNRTIGKSGHMKLMGKLSMQQIFFVNFAQYFCGKVHPKLRQTAYLEHAMDELRVLQTLANFEEFATAFNCDRRDKMQSRHRCRLW